MTRYFGEIPRLTLNMIFLFFQAGALNRQFNEKYENRGYDEFSVITHSEKTPEINPIHFRVFHDFHLKWPFKLKSKVVFKLYSYGF